MRTSGPAMPSTSPLMILSRSAHCDIDRADAAVCGSSISTSEGRSTLPSRLLCFMPRTAPVRPAVLMIAPLAADPATVGKTISSFVHSMCVRSPLQSWPLARLLMPSNARTGKQISGKSARSSSLLSNSVLIDSRIASANGSDAATTATKCRWPATIAQTQAASHIDVLPLPRGIAIAC
jgi:hypothetical protein